VLTVGGTRPTTVSGVGEVLHLAKSGVARAEATGGYRTSSINTQKDNWLMEVTDIKKKVN